ncbi:hypothetical protein A4A49_60740 [Nicotiana attenuata]|uniref:S-protein homolog n=1 Tax=Nicotiana attenuata TaxID=49451 RepID=A0A1J6HX60_NICAT|nr:hypothetical protein A4A49_60740 [Nicotiana attenuata]
MVHSLVKIVFLLFIIMPYNIKGGYGYHCSYRIITRQVHILNNLPKNTPQLKLHCASGDDDLGYNYPALRTDFKWEFCAISNTLYFCHFWWGNKNTVFDVFNNLDHCVADESNFIPRGTQRCIYNVKDDGIYIGFEDPFTGQTIYKKHRDWS